MSESSRYNFNTISINSTVFQRGKFVLQTAYFTFFSAKKGNYSIRCGSYFSNELKAIKKVYLILNT